MIKMSLKYALFVCSIVTGSISLAQDSYVDLAVFSSRHERYLDNAPELAELILDVYSKNKARTDSYIKKAKIVYTKLGETALKRGMLHHSELFQNLRDSKFHVYGYFTFPFAASGRKDLFFCYFAPREAEASRDAYLSFRRTLPNDLIKDTDQLANYYRQNAKRLVKFVEAEKNRHAKALDESSARLAISFRNLDVLEESAKYLMDKKSANGDT